MPVHYKNPFASVHNRNETDLRAVKRLYDATALSFISFCPETKP